MPAEIVCPPAPWVAQAGYELLRNIAFPWPGARVLAVADVVGARASMRPCRAALGIDLALGEIAAGRGRLFAAAVADACERLLRERGFAFSGPQGAAA